MQYALCTLHFAICALHFMLCNLYFVQCTLHWETAWCTDLSVPVGIPPESRFTFHPLFPSLLVTLYSLFICIRSLPLLSSVVKKGIWTDLWVFAILYQTVKGVHWHFLNHSWWSKSQDWNSGDFPAGRPDFKMQIWCINALDASPTTTTRAVRKKGKGMQCYAVCINALPDVRIACTLCSLLY